MIAVCFFKAISSAGLRNRSSIKAASSYVDLSELYMSGMRNKLANSRKQWLVETAELEALNESQDTKISTLIQSMENMKEERAMIKKLFIAQYGNEEVVEARKQCSVQTAELEALNESQDTKISSLIQSMENMKEERARIKKLIAAQTKNQALLWAYGKIDASDYSFTYYKNNGTTYGISSKSPSLVSNILLAFRKDNGYCISNCSLMNYHQRSKEYIEKQEEKFRVFLSEYFYELTGQKPRFVEEDSGWMIYYS